MLIDGTIAARLHDALWRKSGDRHITDLRIGLAYVGIMLDNGRVGLAAVLSSELPPGCTTIHRAGSLAGRRASELLAYLVEGRTPLGRTVGLATANALNETDTGEEGDTLALLGLTDSDRVAMVGMFGPLVKKIRHTGAELSIIERYPAQMNVEEDEGRKNILQKCTIPIITATTIVTDTMEGVLNAMGCPRHVVILGPSTPMLAPVFEDTPVTCLGGASVTESDRVLQIISEGG